MKIELSEVQRLTLETVLINHRGSLAETRVMNRIVERITMDDELKRDLTRSRTTDVLMPTAESFIAPFSNPVEFEFDSNEKEKLSNALLAWENYSIADVEPVMRIMKALDKVPPKLKTGKATFTLHLNLAQRMQLTLFLKQIFGGWDEVVKWASIASHFVLTQDEVTEIRFRAQPSGVCQWTISKFSTDTIPVTLTEAQAEMLMKKLNANDRWTTADLAWLNPLLVQLEEKDPDAEGDRNPLQSPVPAIEEAIVN